MKAFLVRHQVAFCFLISALVLVAVSFFVGFELSRIMPIPYQVNVKAVAP